MRGSAMYASKWRVWFQQSVATRSPCLTPSRVSAAASRRPRANASAYVLRSTPRSARRLTIGRGRNSASVRRAMASIVSW